MIVRGLLSINNYTKKDGTAASSWEMKVWQVAKVLRAPRAEGGDHPAPAREALAEARSGLVYDDEEPF